MLFIVNWILDEMRKLKIKYIDKMGLDEVGINHFWHPNSPRIVMSEFSKVCKFSSIQAISPQYLHKM